MAARDRERALDTVHLRALLGQAVVSAKDQEMNRQEFIAACEAEWLAVAQEILAADVMAEGVTPQ